MIDRSRQGQVAGQYAEQEIQTADSVQLVIKTYEILGRNVARARAALADDDWRTKGESVARAARAIAALQGALDRERGGDVARNLDRVYGWFQHRLSQAHAENSDAKFAEVGAMVTDLLAAWREAHGAGAVAATGPGVDAPTARAGAGR